MIISQHRLIQAIKVWIKVNYSNFNSSLRYFLFYSDEQQTEGPTVDSNMFNPDGSAKTLDPKKTTIGQRRAPVAKKVCLFE